MTSSGADSQSSSSVEDVCPVCGERTRVFLGGGAGRPLVRCLNCGLVRRASGLTADAETNFFRGVYYATSDESDDRQREEFAPWRKRQLARIARRIAVRCHPADVLDIGCADGELLYQLGLLGPIRGAGIEPDPVVAARAEGRLGFPVQPSTFETAVLSAQAFDVVCLLGVLMYFPSPRTALERIAQLLKPGGVLVIELPAPDYALLRFGGVPQFLLKRGPLRPPPHHLFVFEWPPLVRLLDMTGFEVVDVGMEQGPSFGPLSRTREIVYCRLANAISSLSKRRILLGRRMVVWALLR